MPRDSGGNYSLPTGYLAITGEPILASQHNTPLEDIASALTASVPRDGTAGMTGDLTMGGNDIVMGGGRITGLGNIDTTDVSTAVGSVDFTLDAGYRAYRIIFANVRGSVADALLSIRGSTNGGSTFLSTSGDYRRISVLNSSATAVVANQSTTTTYLEVTSAIGTAVSAVGGHGEILITPGNGSSTWTGVVAQSVSFSDAGGYYVNASVRGFISTTSTVNAIRLLMSSGNIAAGNFTLEGIA